MRKTHDYIISFAKNINNLYFCGFTKAKMNLPYEDAKGKYNKGRELNKWGAGARREDSPSMWFPIKGPEGDVYPIRNDGSEGRWRLGREKLYELVKNDEVIFEKRDNGTYIVYEKLRGNKSDYTQFITILKDRYINAKASEENKKLFDSNLSIFDFAKPSCLIHDLLLLANISNGDIVLDFFSGSATTAHAVMQLNAEDGGNRKFIMVQLPEICDEKSEAAKAGYKNICEIGKERIRRAGRKIQEELAQTQAEKADDLLAGTEPAPSLDTCFRVLKLDSTNMKEVYYNPAATLQKDLLGRVDNIKEDRTPEDLLFQVMLELGILPSSKIEQSTIAGKQVFNVADNFLIACFDDNVTDEVVTAIAKLKPVYAVLRDRSFASDSVVANFEQIFAAYSPDTVRRVL